MQIKYLYKLPEWYLSHNKHSTVLSNDIDSLLTCSILKEEKEWDIGYFFDFKNTYRRDGNVSNNKVWCDIAVVRTEKAFDNHVSRYDSSDIYNKLMINPNLLDGITADENYNKKYAGSTALMVWSLYKWPLPRSEKGKMILLCIDGMYKGFYKGYRKPQWHYLVEMFGFKTLYGLYMRHAKEEFDALIDEYNLFGKIWVDKDGKMNTDIDINGVNRLLGYPAPLIELPSGNFSLKRKLVSEQLDDTYCRIENLENVVTAAFVYKTAICYTRTKSMAK